MNTFILLLTSVAVILSLANLAMALAAWSHKLRPEHHQAIFGWFVALGMSIVFLLEKLP